MNDKKVNVDAADLMKPGEILDRLLKDGFTPRAHTLAEIALRGEVAVVVFEAHGVADKALEALGWQGRPVFGITRTRAERAAKGSSDRTWRAWASRPSNAKCLRIFVFVNKGTLLVNYTPSGGYELEAGQGDQQTLD